MDKRDVRKDSIEMGKGIFLFFGFTILLALLISFIFGELEDVGQAISFNLGLSTIVTLFLYATKSKYAKKYSPKIFAIRVSAIIFIFTQVIPSLLFIIFYYLFV